MARAADVSDARGFPRRLLRLANPAALSRNGSDWQEVRFIEIATGSVLPDKLEWVTAEINGKSGFSFTRNYKLGQKVIVYYDENNPNIFYIDSGILEGLTKLTIGMAGLISIAIGVYEFFNKT